MHLSASQMIAKARSSVKGLSADEVALSVVQATARLIDVREPAELIEEGRIVPSHHVPRGVLELRADPSSPDHLEVFDPDMQFIMVCSSGARSALAAATLRQLGFHRVGYLDGGVQAWSRYGFPLDRPTS